MAWWRRKEKAPPPEVETLLGRFIRNDITGDWDFMGDAPVGVSASDRNDAPDPLFVERIPELLSALQRLESTARKAFDFEEYKADYDLEPGKEPFVLQGLSQGEGDTEFMLVFSAEDESVDLGTVFVSFAGERVVDSVLVH